MIYFNDIKNEKNYFEGWFFRVFSDNLNFAIIPSIHVAEGKKTAFIQINCDGFCKNLEFDYFEANDKKVKIGKNIFSADGIQFSCEELKLDINFGKFLPLSYDIMGPFKFGTPCKHKIISMRHSVSGTVILNGETYSLENAVGYIEKDWGKSFPKAYCWLQCNNFENSTASFFLSVAKLNFPFRGLICVLMVEGKEYRFATYNFAKIKKLQFGEIILKKFNYLLKIKFSQGNGNSLFAPQEGRMARTIKEDLNGKITVELYRKNKLLHSLNGDKAGIEWEIF